MDSVVWCFNKYNYYLGWDLMEYIIFFCFVMGFYNLVFFFFNFFSFSSFNKLILVSFFCSKLLVVWYLIYFNNIWLFFCKFIGICFLLYFRWYYFVLCLVLVLLDCMSGMVWLCWWWYISVFRWWICLVWMLKVFIDFWVLYLLLISLRFCLIWIWVLVILILEIWRIFFMMLIVLLVCWSSFFGICLICWWWGSIIVFVLM